MGYPGKWVYLIPTINFFNINLGFHTNSKDATTKYVVLSMSLLKYKSDINKKEIKCLYVGT